MFPQAALHWCSLLSVLCRRRLQSGERTVIDVQLGTDAKQLGEVVVTAAGIEREKKSLGYRVENVMGSKVQQVSEADPLRALQGKVAGVNIVSSSGVPGSATRITMRGNRSLLGNNQPLIVADGILLRQYADQHIKSAYRWWCIW